MNHQVFFHAAPQTLSVLELDSDTDDADVDPSPRPCTFVSSDPTTVKVTAAADGLSAAVEGLAIGSNVVITITLNDDPVIHTAVTVDCVDRVRRLGVMWA